VMNSIMFLLSCPLWHTIRPTSAGCAEVTDLRQAARAAARDVQHTSDGSSKGSGSSTAAARRGSSRTPSGNSRFAPKVTPVTGLVAATCTPIKLSRMATCTATTSFVHSRWRCGFGLRVGDAASTLCVLRYGLALSKCRLC